MRDNNDYQRECFYNSLWVMCRQLQFCSNKSSFGFHSIYSNFWRSKLASEMFAVIRHFYLSKFNVLRRFPVLPYFLMISNTMKCNYDALCHPSLGMLTD